MHAKGRVQARTNFLDEDILNKWMYRLGGTKHDLSIAARSSSLFIKRLQNNSDQVRKEDEENYCEMLTKTNFCSFVIAVLFFSILHRFDNLGNAPTVIQFCLRYRNC